MKDGNGLVRTRDARAMPARLPCRFRIPERGGRVLWQVTNRCNYSCRYCLFASCASANPQELGTEEARLVVDDLKREGFTHLKLTGGEPFLRKDILDIVDYASQRGFAIDLSSNGSLVTADVARRLKEMGLSFLHISLDGDTADVHEMVRGRDTFKRTMKGIETAVAAGLQVRVGCVLYSGNERRLEEMTAHAAKIGAAEIIFSYMEETPCLATQPFLLARRGASDILGEVTLIRRTAGIKISSNFDTSPACGRCVAGRRFLYIDHLGRVSPCTWLSHELGRTFSQASLKRESLGQILDSAEFVSFFELQERLQEFAGCPVGRFDKAGKEETCLHH